MGQFGVLVINYSQQATASFVCSSESQYLLKTNLCKSRVKYRSHVDLFTDGQRCVVNVERGQFWTDFLYAGNRNGISQTRALDCARYY